MKLAVFSDIHANLTALEACYTHLQSSCAQAKIIILGDYIDYGPRPNEVISFIMSIKPEVTLCGNHERAMHHDESSHFSTHRGVESALHTKSILSKESNEFLLQHTEGKIAYADVNKKILLVHGDLSNPFWGKMPYTEMQNSDSYKEFDYVISGHTHVPHLVEMLYADANALRGKKKTVFINPGSVGQPRNYCSHAQYSLLDTEMEEVFFHKVPYDVAQEQSCFSHSQDIFYKERLTHGI